MPKETFVIAGVLTVVVALMFLGLSSCGKKQELLNAQSELAAAHAAAAAHTAEAAALRGQLAAAQEQIETLRQEKEAVSQMQGTLEQDMRNALESRDITISNLQGRLTVSIVDRIMFESGQADLQPAGQDVMRKVATVVARQPGAQMQVVGHTDNVPISTGARHRFASNWELSTARATAAVRYLTEQCGVDPRRLAAVGRGEFVPLSDNATAEGRAANRRIEVVVLPEEGALARPMPPGTTPVTPGARAASTNAPVDSRPLAPVVPQ